MTETEKLFEKYAKEGEKMDALEALRLLTKAYMKECGISLSMRTTVYTAAEQWLYHRLPKQNNNPFTKEQSEEPLINLMPLLCKEYDPEYYSQWDICGGLTLAQEGETVDDAYKRICLIAVEERRYDIPTLRAFCWAIKKYPYFFELWLDEMLKS